MVSDGARRTSSAVEDEAGFIRPDAEQPLLVRARHGGLDRVLELLDREGLQQLGGGRHRR